MRLINADTIFDGNILIVSDVAYDAVCSIIEKINNAPTIEAEPVIHGKWIFTPKDAIEMMFALPKCSVCGAESSDGGNYCSYCGAKMN